MLESQRRRTTRFIRARRDLHVLQVAYEHDSYDGRSCLAAAGSIGPAQILRKPRGDSLQSAAEIGGALAANLKHFLDYIQLVVGVVFVHNLMALATGYGLSTLIVASSRAI